MAAENPTEGFREVKQLGAPVNLWCSVWISEYYMWHMICFTKIKSLMCENYTGLTKVFIKNKSHIIESLHGNCEI